MTRRIFHSILLASALILILGVSFLLGILYQYFEGQIKHELEVEVNYLSLAVEGQGAACLDNLYGQEQRVTLIGSDGTVLFDNQADVSAMENHSEREEFVQALQSGSGYSSRTSETLSEITLYFAKRLSDGKVLRISSTQYTSFNILLQLLRPMLWILLLMLILSGIIASRAAKKIVVPINQIDLDHVDESAVYDEIAPLLLKINRQQRTIREQIFETERRQQEFSIITDNMSEGLIVIDQKTDVLSCNSSALRLLDAQSVQRGQSVLNLNRSEPFCRTVESVLSGRHESVIMDLKNGYCQLLANPVVLEGNRTAGAVLLLVDVTEKMQREELRREFTANVSHELKTPLTSISGFAEIIQSGIVKQEDVKQFAGRIFVEAQRLITLVNDIIKISQLDEGKFPYDDMPCDLLDCVQSVADRLDEAAKRAEVSIAVHGDHAAIHGPMQILDEVVYNLVDNGIKYNKKGGMVSVTVSEDDKHITLTVQDTGIGISPADQQRVFERFYRVDKSHSKEIGGTGLGLSIVKHGAACLGAKLSLQSTLGSGSTFILTWEK